VKAIDSFPLEESLKITPFSMLRQTRKQFPRHHFSSNGVWNFNSPTTLQI